MDTYLNVGLIGCGSIGTTIARAIDEGLVGQVRLVMVYDVVRVHAERLVEALSRKPLIADDSDELIMRRDIQLVVEAASQEAVREYSLKVLREGKDLMVMSSGALIDEDLLSSIMEAAERYGRKVYVPSGALVGLDNIKSAVISRVYEVTLTTRKPPRSFEDAAYIREKKIDLRNVKEPILLYEGSAREAVKLFPRNVNVAASLSLAGVGADRTRVRIIIDPHIDSIVHEVYVKGEFGEIKTRTVNRPFPDNPKTSYIAALSAIATLKKIASNIIIGT